MSLKNPNLLGRLVPSSCPVVARRAKSEARRAKSDLFGEVLTKTEAGSDLSGRSRRRSLKPKVLTTVFLTLKSAA